MSWNCKQCGAVNPEEAVRCEVCEELSPFLTTFNVEYKCTDKVIVSWSEENSNEIKIIYKNKKHNVTNWKAVQIKLSSPLSILTVKLTNDTAERTYVFGIKKKN